METLLFRDNRQTATVRCQTRSGTGSFFLKRGSVGHGFLNSCIYQDDSTIIILKENILDDNLIKLKEKFNDEINKFQEIPKEVAEQKFKGSLFYLSTISPEKITVEVTENDSLYFSLIKNEYSIYLEEHLDDGEVNVTLFKNGVKQNSISGNIQSVSHRLHEVTSY